MNENNPPQIPMSAQSKTSAHAIWSLVLGILGLMCFSIIAAIPGVICGHVALIRIKSSLGTLGGKGLAIAGLITGYLAIAWAIIFIPLMMAIAIPNFVKARDTAMQNACINNLRIIDAAKQQWALEHKKTSDDVPTVADLTPYLKDGKFPVCPTEGTYTIGKVSELPTCSFTNHKLPSN